MPGEEGKEGEAGVEGEEEEKGDGGEDEMERVMQEQAGEVDAVFDAFD